MHCGNKELEDATTYVSKEKRDTANNKFKQQLLIISKVGIMQ